MTSGETVPVVCAVIEQGGRVLIAQRPAHKHLGLLWEFPGGKVEPGETAESALHREINEELGCRLVIIHRLPTRQYRYEAVTIEMTPFVGRLHLDDAEPAPHEHSAVGWVVPQELTQHALAPADLPVVNDYLQWLARPSFPA